MWHVSKMMLYESSGVTKQSTRCRLTKNWCRISGIRAGKKETPPPHPPCYGQSNIVVQHMLRKTFLNYRLMFSIQNPRASPPLLRVMPSQSKGKCVVTHAREENVSIRQQRDQTFYAEKVFKSQLRWRWMTPLRLKAVDDEGNTLLFSFSKLMK